MIALGTLSAEATLLQLVAAESQAVFAGSNRVVNLCWCNPGRLVNETDIRSRTMQLTSATAVSLYEKPWKKLQVLPGQTVLETAILDFPPVRAKTRFLVEWVDSSGNVLGSTEVFVYPTNLLAELGIVIGHDENALGVYDPENELKPLLKNLKIGFVDLENVVAENFHGKLAIINALGSSTEAKTLVTTQIKSLVENGVAVVWVMPATQEPQRDEPQPSFYSVPANQVATIVIQPAAVARLAENPRSQANLIFFCKLALHPQSPILPSIQRKHTL
ncbi:MAG TPA: hypothetical protein VHC44_02715 [Verrucomicrobiae bacterium]|nr:hypothetical protein [Verrucomicrobiae bacterium]